MAILFDRNRTKPCPNQTKPIETHWYGSVPYRTGLVWRLLDGQRFQTIFHDRTIPIFDQYGSLHPELGGSGQFQKSWLLF